MGEFVGAFLLFVVYIILGLCIDTLVLPDKHSIVLVVFWLNILKKQVFIRDLPDQYDHTEVVETP